MKISRGLLAVGAIGLIAAGGFANSSYQHSQPTPWLAANYATTTMAALEQQATYTAQQATASAATAAAASGSPVTSNENSNLVVNNKITPGPGQRLFVFVNNLNQTIWVESLTSFGGPLTTTNWELPAGQSVSTTVPDHWDGRFWGDTACTADGTGKPTGCATGHCPPGTNCENGAASFATLGEFNLIYPGGNDIYDISLVDGYNLPMYINTIGGTSPDILTANGCLNTPLSAGGPTGCTTDVNALCNNSLYSQLQVKDGAGNVVACKSACTLLQGEGHSPGDAVADPYCCPGGTAHGTTQTCQPATWAPDLNSAKIFKQAEPFAYSYTYDDATSTLSCAGSCGYRITFGLS